MAATTQDFSLWGHSVDIKTPLDPRHIVYQSDEKGLRKVTKLFALARTNIDYISS